MTKVTMTVNGKAVSGEVEGRTLLVNFLREGLGLTGTHVGCDTSQCGACVVHVDGKAVKSCTMLAAQADGREITTIEGLKEDRRAVVGGGVTGPALARMMERLGIAELQIAAMRAWRDLSGDRDVTVDPLRWVNWLLDDLAAVVRARPHALMLPKCHGAQDVIRVSHYLDALEAREGLPPGGIGLMPIATETARATLDMPSYGQQPLPRLAGLIPAEVGTDQEIDDEALVTDELVDYIHRAHTWSPAFDEARKQSVSVPHDYTPELAGIHIAELARRTGKEPAQAMMDLVMEERAGVSMVVFSQSEDNVGNTDLYLNF